MLIRFGYVIVLSALVNPLAKPVLGELPALILTSAVSVLALATMGRLTLRLVRGHVSRIEMIALAMLAYASVLALGIAVVGVRAAGWQYAMEPRYASYSIYTLSGLTLGIASIRSLWTAQRCLRFAAIPRLAVFSLLGSSALVSSWNHVEGHATLEQVQVQALLPYTLDPWGIPRYGYFVGPGGPRRAAHAALYRPVLLDARKFIFSTPEYEWVFRTGTTLDAAGMSPCAGEFVIHSAQDELTGATPMRAVALRWVVPASGETPVYRFVDGDLRVLGWVVGPNHSKHDIGLAGRVQRLLHAKEAVWMHGFLNAPDDGDVALWIQPLGADGQVLCMAPLVLTP